MSADDNEDSQMLSSPDSTSSSPTDITAANSSRTPRRPPPPPTLSPPSSQHDESGTAAAGGSGVAADGEAAGMALAASGAAVANSNGKRPIQTISNGGEDGEELAAMNNGKARAPPDLPPPKTHALSGYTWRAEEDAPGWAWTSKKAADDAKYTMDGLVHLPHAVQNRYGDPFEAVEREAAMLASLKTQ